MPIEKRESYEDLSVLDWMQVIGYPPAFIIFMPIVMIAVAVLGGLLVFTDFMGDCGLWYYLIAFLVMAHWSCVAYIIRQRMQYTALNNKLKRARGGLR